MWNSKLRCPIVLAMTLLALLSSAAAAGEREDLGSSAVIAPSDEPGERLRVTGTVFAADGETPVAGAVLYVYHTDIRGYYSGTTTSTANPRLKAHLRTGADAEGVLQCVRDLRLSD